MGRNIRLSTSFFGRSLDETHVCYSRYKFQSSLGTYEDKTAILSDADNVWTTVRHLHMREAIDKLMIDFNKFLEDNAVFKGYVTFFMICIYELNYCWRSGGATNLTDMKDMLASLPQYQEQREKVFT